MTYYILLPGDDEHSLGSPNTLGEESLGNFYPDQGLQALLNIIDNNPHSKHGEYIKNMSGWLTNIVR